MKAALVIMAAGIGSRYGGNKQIDGMGPNGEPIMEYTAFDAIRAGFTKVVFIIKPELEAMVEERIGSRLRKYAEVCYAYQDFSSIPDIYTVPAERVKPFGTVHAALCAASCVSEPFAIMNADDYYGVSAFKSMYEKLSSLPADGEAAMVGYRLKNTVSEHGAVTRGICLEKDGCLSSVVEVQKIALLPDGSIVDSVKDAPLDPDSLVSMNYWGFAPSAFKLMDAHFRNFLMKLSPGEIKGEYLLPTFVDDCMKAGEMKVHVLSSDSPWFGVTYREDAPIVRAELKKLHDDGTYPEKLF